MPDLNQLAANKVLGVLELMHSEFSEKGRNFDRVMVEQCMEMLKQNYIDGELSMLHEGIVFDVQKIEKAATCSYTN